MPTPSRNGLYEATIRRMVKQSLEQQEKAFAEEHGADTEAQLLEYLQENAKRLGHSPEKKEIVGWQMIQMRFGSWEAALERAGLPRPERSANITGFARIQEEIARQKQCYREKKTMKKLRHEARIKSQQEKRKT